MSQCNFCIEKGQLRILLNDIARVFDCESEINIRSQNLSYDISHLENLHVTCDNMLDGMCMLFYRPI